MKTWIKRTLIATVSAGALVAGVAYSQGGSHHFGRHGQMSEADMAQMRERMTDRISKELALDATQKQYLVALGAQMEAQRKAMSGGQPGAMREQMQALIAGNQFDVAKAQTLVNEKTEAIRLQSPQVISAAATFFNSLKPEQQQKVREFMNRRGGMGMGHGPEGGHRGQGAKDAPAR
jgi:periplasmic protein CpxP/Spy